MRGRARRGRQQRGAGEMVDDPRRQVPVQRTGGQADRHERERVAARPRDGARQVRVDLRSALEQGIGQRPAHDVPPRGVERQRRDEQGGERAVLVGRRRRVHDAAPPLPRCTDVRAPWARGAIGCGRCRAALASGGRRVRQRPRQPPVAGSTLLDRAVGEQRQIERSRPARDRPARLDVRDATPRRLGPRLDLDDDLRQRGQREQQRVADVVEQRPHLRGRGPVPQLEHHGGVVTGRRTIVVGQREPQGGQRTLPAADLRAKLRGGRGEGEPDAARDRADRELVGDRPDRGEPDAEPADRRRRAPAVALGRRAQRRERGDTARVEGRARVRGDEDRSPVRLGQPQEQLTGNARPGRGVGGVLRELDDHPVAVVAAGVILLGVGILAEPGG